MDLTFIIRILTGKTLQVDSSILDDLASLKASAISVDNEQLANEIWFYETVARIQTKFSQVFSLLKSNEYDNYFQAWCQLERIEIDFSHIRDNFPDLVTEFNLSYIETTVFNLQKLFPYTYFSSRETIIKSSKCTICQQPTSIRNPCPHKVGKLYNGELCCTEITDMEFININVVTKPFDKFAVLFSESIRYNYHCLQELMKNWDNPYTEWFIETTFVKKPEYQKAQVNDKCPCGSGKKYKRCCRGTPYETIEHFCIVFKGKTFAQTPMSIVRTVVQDMAD